MNIKLDSLLFLQNSNLQSISNLISKLQQGDILRAQIIDIQVNEILLKLLDGSFLKASSMIDLNANKGDYIDLLVKEKSDKQIFLETIKQPTQKEDQIEDPLISQLTSIQLEPSDKNIEIAKHINKFDLPLVKESFIKILDYLKNIENSTPEKLAFLMSNNIIPKDSSLTLLNNLVNKNFNVASELKQALSLISDAKKEVVEHSGPQPSKVSLHYFNVQPQKTNELGSSIHVKVVNFLSNILDELKNSKQENPDASEILVSKFNNLQESDRPIPKVLLNELIAFSKSPNITLLGNPSKDFENTLSTVLTLITTKDPQLELPQNTILDNSFKLLNILKTFQVPTHDKKETLQVLEKLNKLERDIDNLYLKINSQTLGKDIHPKKIYNAINDTLDSMKQDILPLNISQKEILLAKVDDIQSNIKFITDIGNSVVYAQIPIKLVNSETTGELYILKRNKKKKLDVNNASLFISLNTENIGKLDCFISISNRNINLNLRLENQDIISFIKENYTELYNRIKDKGYRLVNINYKLSEEDINPLTIEEFCKKQELSEFSSSIDYKV